MRTHALVALSLCFLSPLASADEVSANCSAQAGEYAFARYADDDFDYIEAISGPSALYAVEQNNTDLAEGDIDSFRGRVDSGNYEFYEVSAGGIGDFIHLLIYQKSDCAYVGTISVFEE